MVLGIGNHAYDGLPRVAQGPENLLAQGALAGEVGAGGGLIDHRDRVWVMSIIVVKEAPLHDAHPRGPEVVGIGAAQADTQTFAKSKWQWRRVVATRKRA